MVMACPGLVVLTGYKEEIPGYSVSGVRTPNIQIQILTLYPIELRRKTKMPGQGSRWVCTFSLGKQMLITQSRVPSGIDVERGQGIVKGYISAITLQRRTARACERI